MADDNNPDIEDYIGRGDAMLSSADDCKTDCLQTLADAVAARTRHVRNIVGDDSWFPDERWSPGMSWNNIQSRYGTGVSALTLDDNELVVKLAPGTILTVDSQGGATHTGYWDAAAIAQRDKTGTWTAERVYELMPRLAER